MRLLNEWGTIKCCQIEGDPIFMDDDKCPCGCRKHHYHCRTCGKLVQVG
ncbi:MAG: hypothetical protein WC307_06810 [Candidatus Nanoarchaeia archaeon]|jgi:Fe2+ or Zn2+ uptake regulation protein